MGITVPALLLWLCLVQPRSPSAPDDNTGGLSTFLEDLDCDTWKGIPTASTLGLGYVCYRELEETKALCCSVTERVGYFL